LDNAGDQGRGATAGDGQGLDLVQGLGAICVELSPGQGGGGCILEQAAGGQVWMRRGAWEIYFGCV